MTRERAKELLPIIQAFAEGKKIEFMDEGFPDEWKDAGDDAFNVRYSKYRIKPEPRHFWIGVCKDNETRYAYLRNPEDHSYFSEIIEVVEVI